jgi:hypothetical protein
VKPKLTPSPRWVKVAEPIESPVGPARLSWWSGAALFLVLAKPGRASLDWTAEDSSPYVVRDRNIGFHLG